MTPPFTITTRREPHTHYVRHSIVLANGRVIHEQLSPYGPGEPETRIREYLTPPLSALEQVTATRLVRVDDARRLGLIK